MRELLSYWRERPESVGVSGGLPPYHEKVPLDGKFVTMVDEMFREKGWLPVGLRLSAGIGVEVVKTAKLESVVEADGLTRRLLVVDFGAVEEGVLQRQLPNHLLGDHEAYMEYIKHNRAKELMRDGEVGSTVRLSEGAYDVIIKNRRGRKGARWGVEDLFRVGIDAKVGSAELKFTERVLAAEVWEREGLKKSGLNLNLLAAGLGVHFTAERYRPPVWLDRNVVVLPSEVMDLSGMGGHPVEFEVFQSEGEGLCVRIWRPGLPNRAEVGNVNQIDDYYSRLTRRLVGPAFVVVGADSFGFEDGAKYLEVPIQQANGKVAIVNGQGRTLCAFQLDLDASGIWRLKRFEGTEKIGRMVDGVVSYACSEVLWRRERRTAATGEEEGGDSRPNEADWSVMVREQERLLAKMVPNFVEREALLRKVSGQGIVISSRERDAIDEVIE